VPRAVMGMVDRAMECGGTATGSSAGGSGAAVDAQDSGEGPCDGARAEVHRGGAVALRLHAHRRLPRSPVVEAHAPRSPASRSPRRAC
jgi:hypothetical protein